jgi:peptidyl-dipeptidase A
MFPRGKTRVMMMKRVLPVVCLSAVMMLIGCKEGGTGPTAQDARAFVEQSSADLKALYIESAAKSWAKATNITEETIAAEAEVSARVLAREAEAIRAAAAFDGVAVDEDTRRQLDAIKQISLTPAPADPAKTAELADIMSRMDAHYGTAKVCDGDECLTLDDLSKILAESRDYDTLTKAWVGWHDTAKAQRPLYARFVELANEGAREIGYADVGVLWRSGYDMAEAELRQEVERLWQDVAPLYEQLHCYARDKLSQHYGADKVPPAGRIPAHLLGNMWAQQWNNVDDLLTPYKDAPRVNVTPALQAQAYDAIRMMKLGEGFFSSLGFAPLPQTFWERSLFTRPEDREVICHASAWNMDFGDDVRIKMCTQINQEDLITIHHELGHNYYQRAYNKQPLLYQTGAHDGFHEAIGDAIALSITPAYLQQVGLLSEPFDSQEATINTQMSMALDKIAFLPFGRLMDEWRWQVFSGEISPDEYNEGWWRLRRQYQGIEPPVARTEADFDPGAKYHIPGNTPYLRYFLSFILQFQLYEGLCKAAGHTGPLHECSYYGSKEAGEKLNRMMEMGRSRPWPEALEVVTGTRTMDAGALKRYFAPLTAWLAKANEGKTCGWPVD